MKKIIPIFVIALVLVGSGSFYGGMKYQQGKKSVVGANDFANMTQEQRQQRFAQMGGQGGQGGQRTGAGAIRANGLGGGTVGEIIAQDDKSLTIKLRDGGSKIVFFSADTKIMKTDTGSLADLKVGQSVMANGAANADGSVTAQSIQLTANLPFSGPASSTAPAALKK
jgi:hypothetical protein